MSEGPEVRIVADKIGAALLSKEVKIETILQNKLSDEIKSKIIGSSAEYVKTFGKNIVIKFSSNIYLRNHMMMWGKWRIYDRIKYDNGNARPPPRRPTRQKNDQSPSLKKSKSVSNNNNLLHINNVLDTRKDSRVRLTIVTADKVLVQFNGPVIEFSLDDPSTRPPISLLGPDALTKNFDKDQYLSNLLSKSKKDKNLLIAKALLDQQTISGIGNKYKSEILFLCKIYPFTKATSLSESDLEELVSNIPKILNIGYINNGRTRAVDNSIHDKMSWDNTHWVFRRADKKCWKCGTKILSEKKTTQRSTFWCPTCQVNGN